MGFDPVAARVGIKVLAGIRLKDQRSGSKYKAKRSRRPLVIKAISVRRGSSLLRKKGT